MKFPNCFCHVFAFGFRRRFPIEDRPPYPLNNHKGNNAALPTRTKQQHIAKKLSAFEGDEICLISTRTLYPRPPSGTGSPHLFVTTVGTPTYDHNSGIGSSVKGLQRTDNSFRQNLQHHKAERCRVSPARSGTDPRKPKKIKPRLPT